MMATAMALAMVAATLSTLQTSQQSSGNSSVIPSVNAENFKFFTATNPPQHLTQIDWGIISPGENVTKAIYITSSNSKTYRLTITTSRWGPDQAQEYMAFTENGTGQTMTAQSGIIGLTLQVFENCTGITWFSFDIIVNFEEVI